MIKCSIYVFACLLCLDLAGNLLVYFLQVHWTLAEVQKKVSVDRNVQFVVLRNFLSYF